MLSPFCLDKGPAGRQDWLCQGKNHSSHVLNRCINTTVFRQQHHTDCRSQFLVPRRMHRHHVIASMFSSPHFFSDAAEFSLVETCGVSAMEKCFSVRLNMISSGGKCNIETADDVMAPRRITRSQVDLFSSCRCLKHASSPPLLYRCDGKCESRALRKCTQMERHT